MPAFRSHKHFLKKGIILIFLDFILFSFHKSPNLKNPKSHTRTTFNVPMYTFEDRQCENVLPRTL